MKQKIIYAIIAITIATALSIFVRSRGPAWHSELQEFCTGPVADAIVQRDDTQELIIYFACANNPNEYYYYIVVRNQK